MGRGNFGENYSRCKIYGLFFVSCAKTSESSEMPFGMLSLVDPRNVPSWSRFPMGRSNLEGRNDMLQHAVVTLQ